MKRSIARADFLAGSAAILGGAAAGGVFVETALAIRPVITEVDLNEVYVRVSGKNYFVPVQAWVSQRVVSMTNATSAEKLRALIERIVYNHEQMISIVTHNGSHVEKLRLYVDVPHQVEPGSHLHDEMGAVEAGGKCVRNYICCTWRNGKECCARWHCCDLV